jgi:hypothetical protein
MVSGGMAGARRLGVHTSRVSHYTGLPSPPWGQPSPKRTPHIPFGWGGWGGRVMCVIVLIKQRYLKGIKNILLVVGKEKTDE